MCGEHEERGEGDEKGRGGELGDMMSLVGLAMLLLFCLGGFEPLYCTRVGVSSCRTPAPRSPRNSHPTYARTFFHGLSYREGMPTTAGMALRNIRSLLPEDENKMKTHGSL